MTKNTKKPNDKVAPAGKVTAAKNKAKQPREQLAMEGMAPKSIKEVEDAADAFRETRDARMELTEEESTAKSVLADVMKKHGLKAYKYKDGNGVPFTVLVDEETTVKVKKDKAPKGED